LLALPEPSLGVNETARNTLAALTAPTARPTRRHQRVFTLPLCSKALQALGQRITALTLNVALMQAESDFKTVQKYSIPEQRMKLC
jgi:hypothetical protein